MNSCTTSKVWLLMVFFRLMIRPNAVHALFYVPFLVCDISAAPSAKGISCRSLVFAHRQANLSSLSSVLGCTIANWEDFNDDPSYCIVPCMSSWYDVITLSSFGGTSNVLEECEESFSADLVRCIEVSFVPYISLVTVAARITCRWWIFLL